MISIHAPVQGATTAFAVSCSMFCISIHAPVQGATLIEENKCTKELISIHAPVQGATVGALHPYLPGYFNPRTRAGCDNMQVRVLLFLLDFNPRTRAGCDY